MELLIYMFVDFALQLIAQKIILRREHTRIFPSHLFEYKIHCGGFFVGGFLHLIIDSYTLSYFLLSTFEYIYMYMCEYHRNTRDYINSKNRRKKTPLIHSQSADSERRKIKWVFRAQTYVCKSKSVFECGDICLSWWLIAIHDLRYRPGRFCVNQMEIEGKLANPLTCLQRWTYGTLCDCAEGFSFRNKIVFLN